ncbi:MAG: hypothetical protein R2771_00575 [Saprospiraceae bacterium]
MKDTSFVLVSIIGFQKDSTFLYPGIKDYYFKLKPDAVSLDEIVVTESINQRVLTSPSTI